MNKKRYMAPHIQVCGLTSMNGVMEPEIGIGSRTGEALSKQGSWFDEDEDIADASDTSFDEENVMTSMDGYNLAEGGEEGNMYDDSLADEEVEVDDYYDIDSFNSDEL